MDNEQAEKFHREYVVERCVRLKLRIRRAEKTNWFTHDCVTWEDPDTGHESLDLPPGLDEEGALRCISIFQLGYERGTENGHGEMKRQIRELIGAASDD